MSYSISRSCKYALMIAVFCAAAASLPAQQRANLGKQKNDPGRPCRTEFRDCKKVAVPEGGSALPYVLVSGLACFASIAARPRKQSI
jgi:hypothetical protein